MADAPDSGSGPRKGVQVQLLSWAPTQMSMNTDAVVSALEAHFASPAWKPRPGERVLRVYVSTNGTPLLVYVEFESTDGVCVDERGGAAVVNYAFSQSMKPYVSWDDHKRGPCRSTAEAVARALDAVAQLQQQRADFFDECYDALRDNGAPHEEAMRLNANVFGAYKGRKG